MARMAFSNYGATWVINNDADEFWWAKTGTLKDTFLSLPPSVNIVKVSRKNFVFIEDKNNNKPFYENMIYKDIFSRNSLGRPLPSKVAHKAHSGVVVKQGNHRVEGIGKQEIAKDKIEIFHFPIRTHKQFLNKIQKGGAAYSRNNELPQSAGRTWRKLYSDYQNDGNLDIYMKSQTYDEERLEQEIQDGKIILDSRLRDYLNNLYNL